MHERACAGRLPSWLWQPFSSVTVKRGAYVKCPTPQRPRQPLPPPEPSESSIPAPKDAPPTTIRGKRWPGAFPGSKRGSPAGAEDMKGKAPGQRFPGANHPSPSRALESGFSANPTDFCHG